MVDRNMEVKKKRRRLYERKNNRAKINADGKKAWWYLSEVRVSGI
jgi:hypothetical protein